MNSKIKVALKGLFWPLLFVASSVLLGKSVFINGESLGFIGGVTHGLLVFFIAYGISDCSYKVYSFIKS